MLSSWVDSCEKPFSDSDFENVKIDYARLFVGAQRVAAPLWESVYFNRERMVFQQQTYEVRDAYAKHGLEVDAFSHEPDDHLAYELLFIAHMFALANERLADGDEKGCKLAVSELMKFAAEHPLQWIEAWCAIVQEKSRSDFYKGYALLVVEALHEAVSMGW